MDRLDQNRGGTLLLQKADRSGRSHPIDIGVVAVRRKNEHFGRGLGGENLTGRLEAIARGHRHVDQDDIREKLGGQFVRLLSGARLTDHAAMAGVSDQFGQSMAHDDRVLDEEHGDFPWQAHDAPLGPTGISTRTAGPCGRVGSMVRTLPRISTRSRIPSKPTRSVAREENIRCTRNDFPSSFTSRRTAPGISLMVTSPVRARAWRPPFVSASCATR